MAGGVEDQGGGIVGLVRLLEEHGEAVEYELLTLGLHIDDLGTRRLSWRDLKVVVLGAPPGGALARSVDPEGAGWTADTYLLAALVDYSAVQVWGGNKKVRRPDPVWRPHVKPKAKRKSLAQQAIDAAAARQKETNGGG